MPSSLYRITGRAPASAIFRSGDSIRVTYIRDGASGSLTFGTRYLRRGFEVPVAGDFSVLIEAESEDVENAMSWITIGRELASIISLGVNAAIDPLQGELAYDITPGRQEREFLQRFIRGDDIAVTSRVVNMDATVALLTAFANHKQRDRLLRSVMQYNQALLYWSSGNELLIVTHLWMGVEAIKKAYLRHVLDKRSIKESELGEEWGFNPDGRRKLEDYLDMEARVRLVCKGDQLHHRIAKEVSDSFEHGFANGGSLFAGARESLIPVASYLREAILVVAGVETSHRDIMLGVPYNTPRGPSHLEQYFRTTLIGDCKNMAAEGYDDPIFDWKYKIQQVYLDRDTWKFSFQPDHELTARFASEIRAVGGSLEIWDGGFFKPKSAAELTAETETKTTKLTIVGVE